MTIISVCVGPLRRRWYRIGPLCAVLGGIWACLPDVDHIASIFNWTSAHRVLDPEGRHKYSNIINIFFFHGWMDYHLPSQGTITGMIWIVLLFGAFFWLNARRIARLENQIKLRDNFPGNQKR